MQLFLGLNWHLLVFCNSVCAISVMTKQYDKMYIFFVHFHGAVSSPGDGSTQQREAEQWIEQVRLLITLCHGTGDEAELSWFHPAAFVCQASETAMGPFFLMIFLKTSYVYNIQVHSSCGSRGRGDKKLYQFLATFPHIHLELALATSHPSHPVCCREGALGKLHGLPGA